MATTAFHSAGLATLRNSTDRLARPSLLAQLKTLFRNALAPREYHISPRLAGQRWCDATEHQMLDELGGAEHKSYRL